MMEVAFKSPEVSLQRSLVGRKLGRYEILAKIASGGMASVYVARAQGVAGFERLAAIKILHANLAHEEEFVRMFLDEARLAARIRHPNVVATLDISDTLDAGYYLVMEYIEGDHLGKLLSGTTKAGFRIEVPAVLRIIIDVLGGLGAAHNLTDEDGKKLNLVHRDISPHNIMVGVDGISRLTDFGIAKAEDRLSHTRDGQIKGKLGYMAPEYVSKGICDARSDLFSLGIVLWECITYTRLFRSETAAESLHKLLLEPIPPPSSVSEEYRPLDNILNKALSREMDRRFQSADEFMEALETVAPSFGGLASLRKIGKIVQKYASERIEREKTLIKDTLHNIRLSDTLSGQRVRAVDDPISDPSMKSAGRSAISTSHTGATPSASELSMRSCVRELTSPHNEMEDPTEVSRSHLDQEQLASISIPRLRSGSRKKWFVAVAVVWCLVLSAIAIWIAGKNSTREVRVIEIPPSLPHVQAEKPDQKVPENSSAITKKTNSEDRSSSGTAEPSSSKSAKSPNEQNEELTQTENPKTPSSGAETKQRREQEAKKRVVSQKGLLPNESSKSELPQKEPAKAELPPRAPSKSEAPPKESRPVPRAQPSDEIPAFNPYLNSK
jgi:eukaryotic-like serine/threonine-protein kinase